MLAQIIWFPWEASTTAGGVDYLLYVLTIICGLTGFLVAVLIIYFSVRYRRRPGDPTPPQMRGNTPLELFWTITPLVIFIVFFVWGAMVYFDAYRAPDDAHGRLRRRQAVDVEVPAPRRAARDQRTARAARPAGQDDADVRGRDPQLLRARLPRPHGRPARPLHHRLVPADSGGRLSPVLLAVLRHEPRRHGRRPSSSWSRQDYEDWLHLHAEGSLALQGRKVFLKYRCVSCHSADANARAPVLEDLYGQPVHLQRRQRCRRRRRLHPRIDLRPRQAKIVLGLGEHHADLQGPGQPRRKSTS